MLSDNLISFLKRHLTKSELKNKLKSDMSLEKDLGMTGIDAVDFINDFFDFFCIEIPEDFKYSDYFGPESSISIYQITTFLMRKKQKDNLDIRMITLGDLDRVIKTRKWNL